MILALSLQYLLDSSPDIACVVHSPLLIGVAVSSTFKSLTAALEFATSASAASSVGGIFFFKPLGTSFRLEPFANLA